jgi:hypothetical protein
VKVRLPQCLVAVLWAEPDEALLHGTPCGSSFRLLAGFGGLYRNLKAQVRYRAFHLTRLRHAFPIVDAADLLQEIGYSFGSGESLFCIEGPVTPGFLCRTAPAGIAPKPCYAGQRGSRR